MLELISAHACHGGEQRIYRHDSRTIGLPMGMKASSKITLLIIEQIFSPELCI